ncbi:MAG: hypothetical protein EOM25_14195 [Deltaproteobacteria bacterium]|nr:hypothetical protein [Deltaproteobacteria bacterium]
MTLEGIREVMIRDGDDLPLPPPPREPGDVRIWSHIWLGPGVELHLDPQQAGLDPSQVRELAKQSAAILAELKNKEE